MMRIVPIPALADNYIWLVRQGSQAVCIDPGQAAPVLEYLHTEKLELAQIWITHLHGGHTAGIAGLKHAHPKCRVFGAPDIAAANETVGEGSSIVWQNRHTGVWHTAGHTARHLCYLLHGSPIHLFRRLRTRLPRFPPRMAVSQPATHFQAARQHTALSRPRIHRSQPALRTPHRTAKRRRSGSLGSSGTASGTKPAYAARLSRPRTRNQPVFAHPPAAYPRARPRTLRRSLHRCGKHLHRPARPEKPFSLTVAFQSVGNLHSRLQPDIL